MKVADELSAIGDSVLQRFESQKRVLSYREFLEGVAEHPQRHTRDAALYLRDAFTHFGTYSVERPWGTVKRWKLFDLPFATDKGTRSDHLAGQEALQDSVYRALEGFGREGRANRLLLLHGPNGSAKSTFAACLMRALEAYSSTDEGALYRFSWIFPRGIDGKTLGFTTAGERPTAGDSYAHLPEEQIDAKLPSELREHPLLVLPVPERRRLLRELSADTFYPDWLWSGELGHKNQQVFQALLTAYRGDMQRVLAHVQVERYYVSRRYRVGAVTIGPEMAVDARERQITADRSLASLPASLSAVTLYESFGELVDAAGGIVEYSDLLKRPLDAWKYLLLAIETGEVALPLSNMPINSVLLASSNELHLRAFQEHPEYQSFRGRLVLLRVPYLRDHGQERGIYDAQIIPQIRKHVAPHVTYLAALWAILTRLRRARPERYDDPEVGRLAADLSPLEKADLYAEGVVPRRFERDESKLLHESIANIYEEPSGTLDYEGLMGASPREMRMILLDAASESEECLSPETFFERVEAFCERDDYEFLKAQPDRGYHDAKGFVKQARDRWLNRVDEELRSSTGLVDESQYLSLFNRYVQHVSHSIKKERIYNAVTGKNEDPDEELMRSVEKMLDVSEADSFRDELMSRVAAWAIDHPDASVDYPSLFPEFIEALEEAYFNEHKKQIATIAQDILANLDELSGATEEAQATYTRMCDNHGYEASSVRVGLSSLLAARYTDVD